MSMKGVFQSNAGKLRDAIVKDDVLAADRLVRDVAAYRLWNLLDKKIAAAMSPQMAAVLTGAKGTAHQYNNGDVTPFLHVMSKLLEANNIRALDVIIRKEKPYFNGWDGTEAMLRIVLSPIADTDRLRYLSQMLENGHDKMTFPGRAVAFALNRGLRDVVALFAQKGITHSPLPLTIAQPEPERR